MTKCRHELNVRTPRQVCAYRSRLMRGISPVIGIGLLASSRAAHASEAISLPEFTNSELGLITFAFVSGLISIFFGWLWYSQVRSQSAGTERMEEVGKAIRDGALAYLRQQVKMMAVLVVGIAVLLYFLYQGQSSLGYTPREAFGVAIFFMLGVGASYLAGYVGMGMATIGNQRTANQARTTFKGALETAFKAGAVSGMMTVGFGLVGACAVFFLFREKAMLILVGFGLAAR